MGRHARVQSSLPGFARVMGPWRHAVPGADTMVWLAPPATLERPVLARPAPTMAGQAAVDRTSPDDADRLWRWVEQRAAVAERPPGR